SPSGAARLSSRASGQKGTPATMSPALRTCRLAIASERVMGPTPWEVRATVRRAAIAADDPSPQEVTSVRYTRMPYLSDDRILPRAVMTSTLSLLRPDLRGRAGAAIPRFLVRTGTNLRPARPPASTGTATGFHPSTGPPSRA